MKFEVLSHLMSDIESRHAVNLKGDLALLKNLESVSIKTLLEFLDEWCKAFLQSAECRNRKPLRGLTLVGVSSRINGGVRNFLNPLLEKIYDVDGKEHSDPCPEAFSDCYQVGSLLAKFGAAEITDEMQSKAISAYLADEDSVSTNTAHVAPEISRLAKKAIEDLLFYCPSWLDVNGRHGPGSVAEGTRNPAVKFARWNVPRSLSFNELPGMTHYLGTANPFSRTDGVDPYKSKVVVVPKKWNKCRTICAEPALLQFCQQALSRELDLTLKLGRMVGCHKIDLHDQTQNAQLALDGSYWHGDWSTLDLSSASDLLSYELVKELWPADWSARLAQVRSKRTELPDGNVLELNKFASMGNATTFPVQSITFWALVCAADMLHSGDAANEVYNRVSVYGDDIICRNAIAPVVVGVLESAGLRVNRNKSFITGSFRESCGIHAYNGIDVTPVYVRTDKYDPSGCASICASANGLHARGYIKAAEHLFGCLERRLGSRLPYSSVGGQFCRLVQDHSLTQRELDFQAHELNLQNGIPMRWSRVQAGYEAQSYLLKPPGRDFLEFRDTGDMWAYLTPYPSDRDRGMRSKPGLRLSLTWVTVCG
jgi:hypothetical protein